MERESLGRFASLGDLYDARADSFLNDGVFKSRLEDDDIEKDELGSVSTKICLTDFLNDKFESMNVEGELKASVMCGMIKPTGAGKYLEDEPSSTKSGQMTFVSKLNTVSEEIFLHSLKKKVKHETLNSGNATHVLTKIEWGARCTVTAEYHYSDEKEKNEIEGSLSIKFQKVNGVLSDINSTSLVDFEKEDLGTFSEFTFTKVCHCDVGSQDGFVPNTFKEAVDYARSVPKLVAKTNEGKGVQLKYYFTDLNTVRKWLKLEKRADIIYEAIADDAIKNVVQTAQNIRNTRQKLKDIASYIEDGTPYLQQEDLDKINDCLVNFTVEESKFQEELFKTLKEVRSGKNSVSSLGSLNTGLMKEEFSSTNIQSLLGKLNPQEVRLAERMKEDSKFVGDRKNLQIFTPNRKNLQIFTPNNEPTKNSNIQKFEIGIENKLKTKEKTILVVGATGAGKSTFLNSLTNYAYGVEHQDKFRFKICDIDAAQFSAKSVTKEVSAFVLNESNLGHKLTIVDTPGFGDTGGLEEDKKTTKLIKELFETKGPDGIVSLDAVCLVVKSTDTRLTAQMNHNFNSVLQLFGKDMMNNIFVIATFSDASEPPVIETLKENKIDYNMLVKVNNSAFFEGFKENDENSQQVNKLYWDAGMQGFDDLFKCLGRMEPKSLQKSAEVLKKREHLEYVMVDMQNKIKQGIDKLDNMREEVVVMEKYASEIEDNKDFSYETKEMQIDKVKSEEGVFNNNCLTCKKTCHQDCYGSDGGWIGYWCKANDWSGNCKICACKANWKAHIKEAYVFEMKTVSVTKTKDDLYKKYGTAKSELSKKDAMLEQIGEEFYKCQEEINSYVNDLKKIDDELKEIAARPNILTAVDYLDLLIQSEKEERTPGWKERLALLKEQREMAVLMMNAKDPNFKPFAKHLDQKGKGWKNYAKAKLEKFFP